MCEYVNDPEIRYFGIRELNYFGFFCFTGQGGGMFPKAESSTQSHDEVRDSEMLQTPVLFCHKDTARGIKSSPPGTFFAFRLLLCLYSIRLASMRGKKLF